MSIYSEYDMLEYNVLELIEHDEIDNGVSLADFWYQYALKSELVTEYAKDGTIVFMNTKEGFIRHLKQLLENAEVEMSEDGDYLSDYPEIIENLFASLNEAFSEYEDHKN